MWWTWDVIACCLCMLSRGVRWVRRKESCWWAVLVSKCWTVSVLPLFHSTCWTTSHSHCILKVSQECSYNFFCYVFYILFKSVHRKLVLCEWHVFVLRLTAFSLVGDVFLVFWMPPLPMLVVLTVLFTLCSMLTYCTAFNPFISQQPRVFTLAFTLWQPYCLQQISLTENQCIMWNVIISRTLSAFSLTDYLSALFDCKLTRLWQHDNTGLSDHISRWWHLLDHVNRL